MIYVLLSSVTILLLIPTGLVVTEVIGAIVDMVRR